MGTCYSQSQKEKQIESAQNPLLEHSPTQAPNKPVPPKVNNPQNTARELQQKVAEEKQTKQYSSSQNRVIGFSHVNEIAVNNARLFQVTQRQKLNTLMHRSIVAMSGSKKNSCVVIVGGGVMLSKNIILTVAHNILDQYKKQFDKKKYKIYLESNGQKYYQIQDWRYLNQYVQADMTQDIQFDYAIIKLKDNQTQPIFESFPELTLPCRCILNKEPSITLDIYGYPVYQNNFAPLDGKGMKISLCQYGLSRQDSIVEIEKDHIIKYAITTLNGQSGSPIFVDNKVIAIHKAGKIKQQCNAGRLMTKDMVNNIQKWCLQLGGDPIKVKLNDKCWHKRQKLIQISGILQRLRTDHLQQAFGRIALLNQHIKEAQRLQELAQIYESQSNFSKAIELYQQSLKICQKVNGKQSFQSHIPIQKIGKVYQKILNYNKSIQYYFRSLYIKQKQKGKGCFESANTLHNIGWTYKNQGNLEKGQEYYNYALSIYEKVKGKGCYQSSTTLNNLGVIYSIRSDQKAIEYFSLALEIQQRVKGEGCFQSANTINNMGIFYNRTFNYAMALECYTSVLQIYQRFIGNGSQEQANILTNMGQSYKNQGNYDLSVKCFTSALQIKSKLKGKDSFQLTEILHNLGSVYNKKLNTKKSLQCYTQALKIQEQTNGKNSLQSANILHDMGVAYNTQMNYDRAIECYGQALQIKERVKGRQCFESVITLNQMGETYSNQGNDYMAIEYYSLSVSISSRGKGNEVLIAATFKKIGNIRFDQRDYDQAAIAFQLAAKLLQTKDMKSEIKQIAVKWANCLRNLKQQAKLAEIITKYGLESYKF